MIDASISLNALLYAFALQPSAILFGLLLVLFSIATTLVFVLQQKASHISALLSILSLILACLIGVLAFDFSGNVGRLYVDDTMSELSLLFSTHRWILMQIPLILVTMSMAILLAYGKDILEKHALVYLRITQTGITVSFFTLLLIGLESLF